MTTERAVNTDYDVIISGCGPTGAALANLLGEEGVRVLVIDKYEDVYDKPRAITLDWEVMRILQFAGVAEEFFPTTAPHTGTNFTGVDGQVIKMFDPDPPPFALGWPPNLTFIQPELERMLRRRLDARETVETAFGWRTDDFLEDGDRVTVKLTGPEGATWTATCAYLVGCDGASSPIRTALGLERIDLEFDEWWVVIDGLQLRETDIPAKSRQYCRPSRPGTLMIGPGNLKRWEIKILPDEDLAAFESPDHLREVLKDFANPDDFDLWRSAIYRFHAVIGAGWREGRVLIAGDAAHQTPPFLGQGLCAGVRDASNLAWKLAHVLRRGHSEALLDSYEAERRPHVTTVVARAKAFGEIIGELDKAKARARDARLIAELEAGRMVTSRQEHIPDLDAGVIDINALGGTLMVQPRVVAADGTEALMDDLTPPRFLYVTDGLDPQNWLDAENPDWDALGGARVAIADAGAMEGVAVLRPTDDCFRSWIAETGAPAALIRPDRYVYATIRDRNDLVQKLRSLASSL